MKLNRKANRLFLIIILLISAMLVNAQNVHSDNGDGTFTNPVISSDFPDIDMVQVNNTCYMLATTVY